MSVVAKPNTFSSNTTISSSQVNANFDTIYNEFNGNISAANLATDAISTAKIADSAVTTAKIADANVTSAKLNEAFIRGRYQSNTTNSAPTGLTLQFGWGFIAGNDTALLAETVTFPTAFSAAPIVLPTWSGTRPTADGTPTGPDWFTSAIGANTAISANTEDIIAASFEVEIRRSDSTALTSANNWGYSWIAIGTV